MVWLWVALIIAMVRAGNAASEAKEARKLVGVTFIASFLYQRFFDRPGES